MPGLENRQTGSIVSFHIPLLARRAVIGPRGSAIKATAKRNKVKIEIIRKPRLPWLLQFEKDSETYAFDSHGMPIQYGVFEREVLVVIHGNENDCKTAQREIKEVVEKEKDKLHTSVVSVDYARKAFVLRDAEEIEKKYPQLRFDLSLKKGQIRIKGKKQHIEEARNKLSKIEERLKRKIHSVQLTVPRAVLHKLNWDDKLSRCPDNIDKNGVWVGVEEIKSSRVITLSGPKSLIKGKERSVNKAIGGYSHTILDAKDLASGNLQHARLLLILLGDLQWVEPSDAVRIVLPSSDELANPANTDLFTEICGEEEKVKKCQATIKALFDRITPEEVGIVPNLDWVNGYQVAELAGLWWKLFGGNLYLVDEKLMHGSGGEKKIEARLALLESTFQKWREINATWGIKTLTVSPEVQRLVKGPKGATLEHLRGSFKSSDGEIQIVEQENKISIRGPKEEFEEILSAIKKISKNFETYGDYHLYEDKVEVPSRVVSGLIGKNRHFWRELKDKYSIHLRILDKGKGTRGRKLAGNARTTIILSGIELSVIKAKAEILEKADELDVDLLVVHIDGSYHKRIAGHHFKHVNSLEKEHNVKILFPSDRSKYPFPSKEDQVVVHGKASRLEKSKELLLCLLETAKLENLKREVEVPLSALTLVCEGLGDNMALRNSEGRLCSSCMGVDYNLKEEKRHAVLTLMGSKESLDGAIAEINKMIESMHVVNVSVPRNYHHLLEYQSASWKEIMQFRLSINEEPYLMKRMIQLPEKGAKIHCCSDKARAKAIAKEVKRFIDHYILREKAKQKNRA